MHPQEIEKIAQGVVGAFSPGCDPTVKAGCGAFSNPNAYDCALFSCGDDYECGQAAVFTCSEDFTCAQSFFCGCGLYTAPPTT